MSGKVKGSNVSTSIKCNYMKSIKNLFTQIVQRLKRMKLYRTKIGLKIKLSKCRRLLHTFPLESDSFEKQSDCVKYQIWNNLLKYLRYSPVIPIWDILPKISKSYKIHLYWFSVFNFYCLMVNLTQNYNMFVLYV